MVEETSFSGKGKPGGDMNMICPMALASGVVLDCVKKRCPFWIKDDSGKLSCLYRNHCIVDYILSRRALTNDEQNEILNHSILSKKDTGATYL